AAPAHARGGDLVIEKPAAAPPAVVPSVEPARWAKPKPEPSATPNLAPAPAAPTFRHDAPQLLRPLSEPRAIQAPAAGKTFALPPSVLAAAALAGALGVLATALLARRRHATVAAEPALVSWTDALLPHDTDLLRERDAEHRQRVHDRDRGYPRSPSE